MIDEKTELSGQEAQVWAEVAAAGTDPDLLAAVVVRAAADPPGFARQWRQMLRIGTDPMQARNEVARTAVLTSEPGMSVASAWRDRGVRVTLAGDPAMPDRLVQTGVQPPWLAMQSMAPAAVNTAVPAAAVAIVGSRKATAYGRGMASWLAESAGSAGVRVVSGGAVGIDAAAHGAALATAGATTVVLGCGHDVVYPRPHATPGGLFAQVVAAGGQIVSESLPFDAPRPFRVRSRNRLIAAMADVVVVVEGGRRSGSLVTANWAADLGIPVLAVPGDARAPGSQPRCNCCAKGQASVPARLTCWRPCPNIVSPSGLMSRTGKGQQSLPTRGCHACPRRPPPCWRRHGRVRRACRHSRRYLGSRSDR